MKARSFTLLLAVAAVGCTSHNSTPTAPPPPVQTAIRTLDAANPWCGSVAQSRGLCYAMEVVLSDSTAGQVVNAGAIGSSDGPGYVASFPFVGIVQDSIGCLQLPSAYWPDSARAHDVIAFVIMNRPALLDSPYAVNNEPPGAQVMQPFTPASSSLGWALVNTPVTLEVKPDSVCHS